MLRWGSVVVPWQSVALSAALLVALLVWAWRLEVAAGGRAAEDLLYVVLGVVPGSLVGGRLVHGLAFADVYLSQPAALLDLSRGAVSLLGAVLGGVLGGAYVCRVLGHPVGRWADAAAIPLLLAIGLGKVAMVLGGAGQGAPFDGPWAVAFTGPGPWTAADPAGPAHPSQVYEGLWTLAGVVAILLLPRRAGPWRPGSLFIVAVVWWLAGRAIVAFTWRDAAVLGPLGAEQALTAAAAIAVTVAALSARRLRRGAPGPGVLEGGPGT